MTGLLAALAAAAVLTGILLLVLAFRLPSTPRRKTAASRPLSARLSQRSKILLGCGVLMGIVVTVWTGLLLAIVVVPLAFIGVPALLAHPQGKAQIARLDALEAWTRSLNGMTVAGTTIEQALAASYITAPEIVKPPLNRLLQRIDAGWSTPRALEAFADDFNDPTADLVVAALSLSATMRGPGLAAALEDLASSVAEEAHKRRDIEADRTKPRTTALWVTILSVAGLSLFAVSGYLEPYSASALGQSLLTALIAAYIGLLVWMKRMTIDPPSPRILTRKDTSS